MGKGIWGWGAVGWGFICLQVRPEWELEASAPFLVEDIKNLAPGSYDFLPILLEVKPAPSIFLPYRNARSRASVCAFWLSCGESSLPKFYVSHRS